MSETTTPSPAAAPAATQPPSILGGQPAASAPPWYGADAPAELAALVSNKKWGSAKDALSSYANLEKLVGVDKIAAPREDWKPEQWKEFHARLRPEKPDAYEVKLPEGAQVKLDDAKLSAVKTLMWEQGLTKQQAEALAGWYVGDMDGAVKAGADNLAKGRAETEQKLKEQWKGNYDSNLDVARSVVRKFGDDALISKLESSGLANDPEMVNFFHKLGASMMEDSATGRGGNEFVSGATSAKAEIDKLKGDQDFWLKMDNGNAVGHKEAVERWNQLHKMAYPTPTKS